VGFVPPLQFSTGPSKLLNCEGFFQIENLVINTLEIDPYWSKVWVTMW
jgi:hypothetical protein